MAKQNIPFTLIDESVVQYGFRVLMSGYQPGLFESNPVMLLMHSRATGSFLGGGLTNDIVLPIGKWCNIKVDGSKLVANPEFDDDDEMGAKVENKVIKGYLNGCSISLNPIAVSDEPELMLPGQTGPTITKWEIQECSIVDIPNCRNSLAIRNAAGKAIDLRNDGDGKEAIALLKSLLPTTNKNTMDKELLLAVGLPETATKAEYIAKLNELKLAATNAENATVVNKLKADLATAQGEVATMKEATVTARNEKLVDDAITAKKLVAGDRDKYLKLAKADYDTTKDVIDGMKAYEGIESQLSGDTLDATKKTELDELIKLSGRELYMQGKFEQLKALSEPHYKAKYKEWFGSDSK